MFRICKPFDGISHVFDARKYMTVGRKLDLLHGEAQSFSMSVKAQQSTFLYEHNFYPKVLIFKRLS